MKKISALVLGAVLSIGAQAAAVGYSNGDTGYNFTNALQTTEINQTGSLKLFDSHLGTLTGVTLNLYGKLWTQLTLSNAADATTAAENGQAISSTDIIFSSSIAGLADVLGDYTISLSANSGKHTLAAGQTWGPVTYNKNGSNSVDTADILSLFSSANGGTFSINCVSDSTFLSGAVGGNFSASQNTKASCGADISYTYVAGPVTPPTPTPEPASLALVGLGLVGVAASRRKSRQA